jgi:hypothetical protein
VASCSATFRTSFTLDRYGHLFPEADRRVAERLEMVVSEGRETDEVSTKAWAKRSAKPATHLEDQDNPGHRIRGIIPGMEERPEWQQTGHWRMAVWALRVGYVGLAVTIAGLIELALGSTPWILADGVIIWLAAEGVTLAGFLWSRHELPKPRPRFWSMRFKIIHDTVHARSSAHRS